MKMSEATVGSKVYIKLERQGRKLMVQVEVLAQLGTRKLALSVPGRKGSVIRDIGAVHSSAHMIAAFEHRIVTPTGLADYEIVGSQYGWF